MATSPFAGVTSACSPMRHALVDCTRIPCGLILSVNVLSDLSPLARRTGARFTCIMMGSLRSSLPLRRPSEPIHIRLCAKQLEYCSALQGWWSLSERLFWADLSYARKQGGGFRGVLRDFSW